MKPIRAERIILAVAGFLLLVLALYPPFEYRDHRVHLWLGEGLRLVADREAFFAGRMLLIELAVLEVAVGLAMLVARVSPSTRQAMKFTRRNRLVVAAGGVVLLLLLFPPFVVEEHGSWTHSQYVEGESHVAYGFVSSHQADSLGWSHVYLEVLAAEVAVVVLAAGALMAFPHRREKPAQEPK